MLTVLSCRELSAVKALPQRAHINQTNSGPYTHYTSTHMYKTNQCNALNVYRKKKSTPTRIAWTTTPLISYTMWFECNPHGKIQRFFIFYLNVTFFLSAKYEIYLVYVEWRNLTYLCVRWFGRNALNFR